MYSNPKKSVTEKTEFEKIGVKVIRVLNSNGRWAFKHNETLYDLAPASIMEIVLSPLVMGVDKLIDAACQKKNLSRSELNLLFSVEYFPKADVKFNLRETKGEGWIYDIEALNVEVMQGQAAWICSYLKFYFSEPPKTLFLKLEEII